MDRKEADLFKQLELRSEGEFSMVTAVTDTAESIPDNQNLSESRDWANPDVQGYQEDAESYPQPEPNVTEENKGGFPNSRLALGLGAFIAATAIYVGANARDIEPAQANVAPIAHTSTNPSNRMTPNRVRTAVKNAVAKERSYYGSSIKEIKLDKAQITKKGNFASIINTPPYTQRDDLSVVKFYDYADEGRIERWRFVSGSGHSNLGAEGDDTQGVTSYESTLERISDKFIATSGRPTKMFGEPVKVIAPSVKKAAMVFAKPTDLTIKHGIKKLVVNQKGKPSKIVRYK